MRAIQRANITLLFPHMKDRCAAFPYEVRTKLRWIWKWPFFEKVTGVFNVWTGEYYGTEQEYNERHEYSYFENGIEYMKPYLTIRLSDGQGIDVMFETVQEVEDYIAKIISSDEPFIFIT